MERDFRERTILPCLADGERALVRCQSGSGAGVALSTVPTHPLVASTPSCSALSFSAVSGSHFPSHGASAGVAVPLTLLDLKLSRTGCLSVAGHSWR